MEPGTIVYDPQLSASVRAANSRTEDISTPPSPVPGCPACADLSALRDDARADGDGTSETDANVLLRRHRRRDHLDGLDARAATTRTVLPPPEK